MRNEFQTCHPHNLVGLMEPETVSPAVALSEGAGTRIGRYKLLQLIGEGGFGSVFMAEQETPVVRKVALKIIKLGMDTKQVIARFEAERQALAMMDHPNIARVLDAGATDTGRPYFVMELVKGIAITEYCNQRRLTVKQRLELFIPVCKAIQHAHQKGIIHRDLKPGNVMVTLHDGLPVPKVIDFGIAKATNARLTEHTLFTEYRQLIGTPEYTSPEQADISGLDVDTRSDIYSLGVLLYELLTGTTPFESKELRRCAYGEIQRIIREVEPPKPSTRLSAMGAGLRTLAEHMATDPKKLNHLVAGELDWIVLKSIEKERSRRYETANALARDIERFLAGDSVDASPPSVVYRMRRFVRRYRLGLGMAAAFALVLVAATFISSWQAVRATRAQRTILESQGEITRQRDVAIRERQRADEQAAVAKAVNDFLRDDLLSQASPYNQFHRAYIANRNLTVREALDRAAKNIGHRFNHQPIIEASIRYTLGEAYSDLDEYAMAEPQLTQAFQAQRRCLGELNPHTLRTLERLGEVYLETSRPVEGIGVLQGVLDDEVPLVGWDDSDASRISQYVVATIYRTGPSDEVLNQLVGICDSEEHSRSRPAIRRFWLGLLVNAYIAAGRRGSAQAVYARLRPLMEQELAEISHAVAKDPSNAELIARRGGLLAALGRFGEAAVDYAEAIELAPDNQGYWHDGLMPLLLLLGERSEFERRRPLELKRFSTATDGLVAHRVAKDALSAPIAGAELKDAVMLAEHVVALLEGSGWEFVACQTMGMAEYRRGRFREAIKWSEECKSRASGTPIQKELQTASDFFIAMSYERLGCHTEAMSAYALAAHALETRFPRPGEGRLNESQDWILCHVLRREAEGLIHPPGPATRPAAASQPVALR